MKVYFSISIASGEDPDLLLARKIVKKIKKLGHVVLSEHVVYEKDEQNFVFLENTKKSGFDLSNFELPEKLRYLIRLVDQHWVDQADCLIAFVNNPSFGVGMEIERALLKPRYGLNSTPVLALLRKDLFPKTSKMITGIQDKNFRLGLYSNYKEIESLVNNFLQEAEDNFKTS